jgi:hypothetical protein
MPQMRITSEAHEAAIAAQMGAMTLIERFSLLVKRGARQEEDCKAAYMRGVTDLLDAIRHASDGDPAYATVEQAEAEAERLLSGNGGR